MRTIIAGSRTFDDYPAMYYAMKSCPFQITEVVSGNAAGADRLGETWAWYNRIPVTMFKPDWDKFGKSAGVRRNRQMAEYADALVAFWDGSSKGTAHMIQEATKQGLVVHVVKFSAL